MKSSLSNLVNKFISKPLAIATLGLSSLAGFSQDAQGTIDFNGQNFDSKLEGKEITMQAQFGDNEEFTFTLDENGQARYNLPLPPPLSVEEESNSQIGETKFGANPAIATNAYTQLASTTSLSNVNATILDLNGRVVAKPQFTIEGNNIGNARIDLSNQPTGVYLYTLQTPNGTFTEKIINRGVAHPNKAPSEDLFQSIINYANETSQTDSRGRGEQASNYNIILPSGFGFSGQTENIELALGDNGVTTFNANELEFFENQLEGTIMYNSSILTEDAIVTRTDITDPQGTLSEEMTDVNSGTFSFPMEGFAYDANNNLETKTYKVDVETPTKFGSTNVSFTPSTSAIDLETMLKTGDVTFNISYPGRPAQNATIDLPGQDPVGLDASGSITLNDVPYGSYTLDLSPSDSSFVFSMVDDFAYEVNNETNTINYTITDAVMPTLNGTYTVTVRNQSDSSPLEGLDVTVDGILNQTNASGVASYSIVLDNDDEEFWKVEQGTKDNVSVNIVTGENSEPIDEINQVVNILGNDSDVFNAITYQSFTGGSQVQISNAHFSANVSNAEITYRYLDDLAKHNVTVNTAANGSVIISDLHVDNNPSNMSEAIPTKYQRTIKVPTTGNAEIFVSGTGFVDFEFYTLVDTVTITDGNTSIDNASVIEPKQSQDLTIYTYNETTRELLPATNIILREKGTGTEMYNQTTDGTTAKAEFEDIALNSNGYYMDVSKSGFYGKVSEEFGFDTPDAIYVFSDTARAYINRALPEKIAGLDADDLNEMIPETPNLGAFIVSPDGKTQSAIYLAEPSATPLADIQNGSIELGLPEIRISSTMGDVGTNEFNNYHPINDPEPEGNPMISNANYSGTSTTTETKSIDLTHQTINNIVYASDFRIGGGTESREKEVFGRWYGFRDVSGTGRLMSTVSSGINPSNVKDIGTIQITDNNIQAKTQYTDGNGQPIEHYITIWKPSQDPYKD